LDSEATLKLNVPLFHTSTQCPGTSLHVISFTRPSPVLVLLNELAIDNYQILCLNRNHHGGGVVMYIHSPLSYQALSCSVVTPLENSDHHGLHLVITQLSVPTQKPRKPRLIWKYTQADFDSAISNFRGCQCVTGKMAGKIHVDYGAMYPKVFSTQQA